MTIRWKIAAAGLTFAVTCAGLLGTNSLGPLPAAAQEKAATVTRKQLTADDDGRKPTPIYYGSAACSNKGCHGGEPPKKWVKGLDLITRGNEAVTFSEHDKHAYAYTALTTERGKRMAKVLDYDVTDPKGKGAACLACHATYIKDESQRKAADELHFSVEEGVSCVACHGAFEDWVGAHATMVTARHFRKLTPEQKEAQYGLANLRNPVRQAELCVSCHVGNLKEGKFVTHEMYAAGHPPLPGFEIGTFSDQEPRHWEYLREKKPALQKELGLRAGELEQTELVIIGSLVSLRDTMRLLVAQAAEAQETKDPDKRTLDLANFDCWSCHHGIRTPSWRQERGYGDLKPGTVPWRSWPAELVPTALDHLAQADKKLDVAALRKQYDEKVAALKKGFDAKVYGDPARIEKAAKDLQTWTDSLIGRVRAAYPTADSAKVVLTKMPPYYQARGNDYDSARQAAWAFGTIYDEVYGPKGNLKVREAQARLNEVLKLTLPKGRGGIERELDESLKAIKEYDPKNYRPLMKDLGAALK
jgi:hypothetical protein